LTLSGCGVGPSELLDREDIVPYLMGKGETVSCRPLIVDQFVNINDVQITGNKSFYVKGFLKIRKGKYIQAKVEFCYCLDVHRKDFKIPGLPPEDGESPGEWLGIGTPGVPPLRVTGSEGKRNGGRGG